MVHSKKNQADFNLILRSILQRKRILIGCIVGFIVPVILYNQVSNPVYEASTSIIYERYSGAMNNDSPQKPLDSSIKSNVMEEIKSNSLAEAVVDALPDDIIRSYPIPKQKPANFDQKYHLSKLIQKNISAENITGSDVIVVKTRANSPQKSKLLAQTVTDVLKARNLNARQQTISSARKLIENQLKICEQRLSEAEEALKTYKERGGITFIDQESIEILKRITEAEVLYNKAKANCDASDKRLRYLQKKLSQEREDLLPLVTENASPMVNRLKEELIELEVQYLKLKVQNYDENHPKMLEFKSQIERTKQKLSHETLKIAEGKNVIDPLSQIQKMMEEIIEVEVDLQTSRAQERALKQIIKDYENDLKALPEKELTLTRLIRERDVNDKLYTMLVEKREEARIHEAEQFGNIRTLDPPKMPQNPVSPKKLMNLIIGFILGLIFGLGIVAILENFDNRINTTDQIKRISDLNIIGSIPKFVKDKNGKLITSYKPESMEVEVFRTIRSNLQFLGLGKTKKSILITSCNSGEGKSLVTANLGIIIAQMGFNTLIVDADFRKPRLHRLFGKERSPGLFNLISEQQTAIKQKADATVNADNEISSSEYVTENVTMGLNLISSGDVSPNAVDVLALPITNNILESFKTQYDVVLIDSPPINLVTDASLLSSIVDGVVLVIKPGVNDKTSISKAKEILERTHADLLGVVVNFAEREFNYKRFYSNGHVT